MSGGSVGKLWADIGANLNPLKKDIAAAGAELKNFGNKELGGIGSALSKNLDGIGSSLKGVGAGLTAGLTLPIVGGFAAAIKSGIGYEQELSSIKAVTGSSADEMNKFDKLALKMGADTKFSALESAKGIEELAKAGVSTTDILGGGLEGALSLASAGDLELADAATIASTALNAFKKENLSVAKAGDILAGTANAAAADIKDLKFGLAMSSAVASVVGMTFRDTSAALGIFSNRGLQGSDAGTSLKTMLMNLQPQTDKQTQLFKELGFMTKEGTSAFFDSKGKIKDLASISGLLKDKLGGLTDAQRLSTLETLFGSDAVRAAAILYDSGAEGVNKFYTEMAKTTAADTSKTKMDNLAGSWEQFTGSLETAGITISKMTNGSIRGFVDWLTVTANKFMGLNPQTQQFILIALGIVAAIGPVIFILGSLAGALAALATPMGIITLEITGILIGIAALVIGIVWAYRMWEKWSLGKVINKIDVFDGVSKKTKDAVGAFVDMGDGIEKSLSELKISSKKITKETADNLVVQFDEMGNKIKDSLDTKYKETYNIMEKFFVDTDTLTEKKEQKILDNLNSSHNKEKEAISKAQTEIRDIITKAEKEKRALTQTELDKISEIKNKMLKEGVKALSDSEVESKLILQRIADNSEKITAEAAASVVKNAKTQKEKAIAEADTQYNEIVKAAIKSKDELGAISQEEYDKIIKAAQKQHDDRVLIAQGGYAQILKETKKAAQDNVDLIDWETGEIKTNMQVLFDAIKEMWKDFKWSDIFDFKDNPIRDAFLKRKPKTSKSETNPYSPENNPFFVGPIPAMANGGIVSLPTLAMIGEAGPEAVVPLDKLETAGRGNVIINVHGADPEAVADKVVRKLKYLGYA